MAITIEEQPEDRRPAFHPLAWEVSSNNSGDLNYKYIFQIKQGATILREKKVRPRPVDGFGKQDFITDVQDLLDQTVPFDIKDAGDFQDAVCLEYDVEIKSENSDPIEAAVLVTDQLAYNTIYTRDEYNGLDPDEWFLDGATKMFLTNMAQDTPVLKDDFFWIHFLCEVGAGDRKLVINQFDITKTPIVAPAVETTFTPTQECNMAKVDLSGITFNAATKFISLQLQTTGAAAMSEALFLEVCEPCSTYTRHRIVFLDSKGSYVPLNFDLRSDEAIRINAKTWRQFIDPVTETDTSRGEQRYFIDANETFSINSNILTDEHNRLYKDLLKSTQVWLDVRTDPAWPNTEWLPIEVLTRSARMLKGENLDILKYPLEFKITTRIPTR